MKARRMLPFRKRFLALFILLCLVAMGFLAWRSAITVRIVVANSSHGEISGVRIETSARLLNVERLAEGEGRSFRLYPSEHEGFARISWLEGSDERSAVVALEDGEQVILRFTPGEDPVVSTVPTLALRIRRLLAGI